MFRRFNKPAGLGLVGVTLGLLLALWVGGPAAASNVHLKGGKNAAPSFVDNGLTLSAAGELSGLGLGDVLVTMTATADTVATCTNGGNHQAPGQNPAPVTVSGSEAIPQSDIKNGNTPFAVVTELPDTPIAGAPDCPNPNWTEDIVDLQFTSAVIVVEQPVGTEVLTVTCTISPPSSDGSIPAGNVSCS